jgi:hypothetical protein
LWVIERFTVRLHPKDQKPDARMPAFDESKINDDDLRTLAE